MSEQRDYLTIPVEEPPQRVVSLIPSMTESLFDLNLGDRVVGVTKFCTRPADKLANLPRLGGPKDPDIQQIIDLQPDLVIMNQEENRKEDAEALEAAGVPIWVTFPKKVSDVFVMLWNIMYAFEETSMVPRVRLIEQTYDWVLGVNKENEDKPCKVFVPIWLNPLMTINGDTYVHDLLRVCGGTNVFAGLDDRYPQVEMDAVVEAQPDVILLPSEPFRFSDKHLALFSEQDVPAAHKKQIHLVDGSLLTWHGTRLAYALNDIPSLLCSTEESHD